MYIWPQDDVLRSFSVRDPGRGRFSGRDVSCRIPDAACTHHADPGRDVSSRIPDAAGQFPVTVITSTVPTASCISASIFSASIVSSLRMIFMFGLVTGCFATKIVQQSS